MALRHRPCIGEVYEGKDGKKVRVVLLGEYGKDRRPMIAYDSELVPGLTLPVIEDLDVFNRLVEENGERVPWFSQVKE